MDGDGRGGAALSMRSVTGKPIKLIGVGEKMDALEDFHPARLADRILGMGDIVSLVEKAAQNIDAAQAAKMAEKMRKGVFDLNDLSEQLAQIEKLGGMGGIMGMLPGVAKMKEQLAGANLDDKFVKRQRAIISSMTPQERRNPDILKASRKKRIAAGSGVTVEYVNRLLKQHRQMADMMKAMGGGGGKRGMMGKLGQMMGLGGGMPMPTPDADRSDAETAWRRRTPSRPAWHSRGSPARRLQPAAAIPRRRLGRAEAAGSWRGLQSVRGQEEVIPTLETERLILREWRADDFEPFAAIYADEAQARFIGGVETRDNAWRRMAAIIGHWRLRGYGLWVVAPKETGAFVSWTGCWNPEGFPEPEIGYCIAPSHQRQGYAREAARAALVHAYDGFGWTKAASLIVLDNLPSIRLAECLGARLEREVDFRGARWGVYRHLPPEAVASSTTFIERKT